MSPRSAFTDGFGGGMIGGILYCGAVAWLDPGAAGLAWMRVLSLALAFGIFEMWRVTRQRTLLGVRRQLVWVLAASAIALWALGAVVPTPGGPDELAHPQVSGGPITDRRA